VSGIVYLVGAGPGDADLLTVKGRRVLERADLVVHDRLGTETALPLCRPGAELVNAGKAPGRARMRQEEINALLIAGARAGRTVVRLKGGDPFVLGRGGEEAEALAAAGVRFEVVPGITSAIGAPAYAGIPLTQRGLAHAFTMVSGHLEPDDPLGTDWEAVARLRGTIVLLMAMGRLDAIAGALIAGGRPPDEPAAAVQWGTTARQRTIIATLATIAAASREAGLDAPAVVVVGAVAELGRRLAWFEAGPLAGRSVVVTRARAQASDLAASLGALGAEVVELPAIRIDPVPGGREIDAACAAIGGYDLLVMTSANGVDQLFARLAERGADARALSGATTVVAIGPATADRLAAHGVRADLVPQRFVAEGILEALAGFALSGRRALVARAREARPDLVQGLRARGAVVEEVALYDTRAEPPERSALEAALAADYLTFTSSSTVRNFMAPLDPGQRERAGRLRVVSIGPITSAAARAAGLTVHAEAAAYTVPGLVEALVADAVGVAAGVPETPSVPACVSRDDAGASG
jgi:uroporphyrinogen III methyltransferase/synthase